MSSDDTRELGHSRSTRLSALWSRRWRTRVLVVALVSAGAIGVGGYTLATVQGRAAEEGQRAEQEQGRADENFTAVEQLCAQVVRLGRRCVVEPAELQGDPVPPTEAQLRPLVAEFVDGWLADNPPADGRDAPSLAELTAVIVAEIAAELERNPPPRGEPGPAPTAAQIRPIVIEEVAAFLDANPPPPGEDGEDGQDGTDGTDGQPGADSTVPGPAGEPVLSWTFTVPPATPLGEPTTYECTRTESFDPNSPTYRCDPVEPDEG